MRITPASIESRPDSVFSSVVLPQPEGPITATISPLRMVMLTPRSACTMLPSLL